MGIEIPGAVEWLVPIVVGADWPEGDETALRRLSEAWTAAGTAVGEVAQEGNGASAAVLGCMTGATSEAFDQYWKQFVEGDAYLVNLQQLCTDLASGCDDAALNIEYTKLSIIGALIVLAAQIAAMIASAVATFGASTAGIPIAQVATQSFVRILITQLIKQIVVNVAINVGMDVLIQAGQFAFSDRKSWDVDKTVDAGIAGVAAGVAGGLVGGVGTKLGTTTSSFVQAAGRGAVEGAIAGAGGNILTNLAHGKNSWEDLGNAALSGGVSGSVGGALGGMSNRHQGLSDTSTNGSSVTEGSWDTSRQEYTAGSNTQGHAFTTPDGTLIRANVEGNPYGPGWSSEKAGHIYSDGGPNNVNDPRDDDYEVKTSANPPRMVGDLDLPDPPKR
ncbi:hypothetical protein [Umezawaea sp. Da 62-37]|uniref:WXG100-like domain-containing protein n=1 Tax=Umezawaea sp. Da 62-37 TaxID=3075927 RepID=UPI0028F6D912|nr:hypothetical protein [Umezawaea sp. Da 62-37]WNV91122.1 hypothetical protein RM788_23435 [Umezawaea sp. Da 62-37]